MSPVEAPKSGSMRPGGRTAHTRQAVLCALQDLLIDDDQTVISMESLATRAGVNRTTIYRRWGALGAIVADLASEFDAQLNIPQAETLREDLTTFANRLTELMTPQSRRLVQSLVGWRNAEVREALAQFWSRRLEEFSHVLLRHQVQVDPEIVLHLLAGPIYYSALIRDASPPAPIVNAAIEATLAACER